MRTIKYTRRFKRDYKRENASQHGRPLDRLLRDVVKLLASDAVLPHRAFDHALSGEWADHRDCHLRPDLVLIYRKPDAETLELVRLGSHSELGLPEGLQRSLSTNGAGCETQLSPSGKCLQRISLRCSPKQSKVVEERIIKI